MMPVILLIILIVVVLGLVTGWIVARRRYYQLWFPSYVKAALSSSSDGGPTGPKHLIFLICDHFEPGKGTVLLDEWLDRYQEVVRKHRDSYGNHVKRTLHYPIEQFSDAQIERMLPLCRSGMAEIEVHLHHLNDTSETVLPKYQKGLQDLGRFGICRTIEQDSPTRFAFVHGDWALDNGCSGWDPNPCGVNNEIQMLASLGCFIDCTFPALWSPAQPRTINSIYYAKDDPTRPKSYDKGEPVRVNGNVAGDLILLQGPLWVDWQDWRYRSHPSIEHGDISAACPLYIGREKLWLRSNVHVLGKPDWVFIKLHSHGCHRADWQEVLGKGFDEMLTRLESRYNDGDKYVLHYVSAREAYNIIKAAEAGKTGDPEKFRDYLIKPYRANQS